MSKANYLLTTLSAEVAEREGRRLFRAGQIDAGELNRILQDCRLLERQANQALAAYAPTPRKLGGSYDSRRL
jgi:hypothetical protein